jgi:hypothetical protein
MSSTSLWGWGVIPHTFAIMMSMLSVIVHVTTTPSTQTMLKSTRQDDGGGNERNKGHAIHATTRNLLTQPHTTTTIHEEREAKTEDDECGI